MTVVDLPATSLDLSVFLGDWRNTNANGGIARIVCSPGEEGRMNVQAWGLHGGAMKDWGTVSARVYSFTFDSREAGAFKAEFDVEGAETVHMQANVKAGVLVVATLNEIRDRSGRNNYFDREFFHRIAQ